MAIHTEKSELELQTQERTRTEVTLPDGRIIDLPIDFARAVQQKTVFFLHGHYLVSVPEQTPAQYRDDTLRDAIPTTIYNVEKTQSPLARYIVKRVPFEGGGLSAVYQAYDIITDTPRIAKKAVFHTDTRHIDLSKREKIRIYLEREMKTILELIHPHIVRVYDFIDDGIDSYMIMEHINGKSLQEFIEEKKQLDPTIVFECVDSITDALAYAAQKGIIHRDLKPSNILYDEEKKRFVLIDFGLSNTVIPSYAEAKIGTPLYMAPEYVLGSDPSLVGELFSLGLVVYEMLTGNTYLRGTISDVERQLLTNEQALTDTQMLSELTAAGIPSAVAVRLNKFFHKALNRNPSVRYKTGKEFSVALHDCFLEKENDTQELQAIDPVKQEQQSPKKSSLFESLKRVIVNTLRH